MMRHQAERFTVGVSRERGPRRTGLLAPYLRTMTSQDALGFAAKNRDLLFQEAGRKKM
jgi:hypothetical protein